MAFLMSRNVNKHVLLALGIDCTLTNAMRQNSRHQVKAIELGTKVFSCCLMLI